MVTIHKNRTKTQFFQLLDKIPQPVKTYQVMKASVQKHKKRLISKSYTEAVNTNLSFSSTKTTTMPGAVTIYGDTVAKKKFTGKELDSETGLYYYGARYLDPKTSRWLSGDPALGDYLPSSGQDSSKLPGMGGVFNSINLHVYHYAGNNPVKYVDPDGEFINNTFSYSKMGDYPWRENLINNKKDSFMRNFGCAITGMANIFTTALNNRKGNGYHSSSLVTPLFINKPENFFGGTDELNWGEAASSMGLTATRSEKGNSDAAIASLLSANMSDRNVFALAEVPITTSDGDSKHWVGVDGNLVDLNNNGDLWIKVSPTSTNDNRSRLNNSNWAQGKDGNMYVKALSITGTVIVE